MSVRALPRRRTELGLLIVGLALIGAAYAQVSLGRTADLPANLQPFLVFIGLLLAGAHLATRSLARHADPVLLPLAGLLNGLGYVMIVRLDKTLANKQATWTATAVGAFVLTLVVVRSARQLERLRYTFAAVGLGLLLLPLLPVIGRSINGSRIWVQIGPFFFQPGEMAKLALAIFFASYLVERRELLSVTRRRFLGMPAPELRHFAPVALAWAVSLVVMTLERDLGSSLLFFALFIAMLYIATGRAIYLVLGALMFAAGSFLSWTLFDHVQTRVRIWLNPWPSASGSGFQIVQSLYAFGSGGIGGTGLALGSPFRIPYAATDFIFAAIGEELGLFGTTAVLAAFLLIVGSGLRIALRADDPFEKLLAAGLTTILGVQTFIIVGGVTRLVPLTGVTLPFVSYGGSSLVINYVLIALLMRLSHQANARALPAGARPGWLGRRRMQRREGQALGPVAA